MGENSRSTNLFRGSGPMERELIQGRKRQRRKARLRAKDRRVTIPLMNGLVIVSKKWQMNKTEWGFHHILVDSLERLLLIINKNSKWPQVDRNEQYEWLRTIKKSIPVFILRRPH